MENKKSAKKILIPVAALAVAVALLLGLWWWVSPKGTAGDKHITITVTYEDGKQEDYTVGTDAEYLKEAADSVLTIEGEKTEYGFAVYTINDVTADFNKGNTYWAIYINGEYGNYSIDQQPVTDGDTYAFVFESY